MAISRRFDLQTRTLFTVFVTLVAICMTARPAEAQEARVPIEGIPTSMSDALDNLLDVEPPPNSLFAARRQSERAATTVSRLMESEGYFAAEVEPWAEGVETFERGVTVQTGPLFIIGDTDIDYDEDEPDEEIRTHIEEALDLIPTGVPARAQPILDVADLLLARLHSSGYPDASMEPVDAVADGELHLLDLEFRLHPGKRASFGEIAMTGLERTHQDFLEQLRPWKRGDPTSPELLDDYRNRLSETGVFKKVTVDLYDEAGAASQNPGERIVSVNLEERPRRTISLGTSASTSEGIGVEAQWQLRNLTGRADTLSYGAQIATLERRLEVGYVRPHTGKYGRNLHLGAEIEDFETDAFDQTGASVSASVDEQVTKQVRGTLGLEAGFASINDQRTKLLNTDRRDIYFLTGLASAEYTGVANVLDPVNGLRARLSVEPGITYGDDTIGFSRISSEISAYRELGSENLILALRGQVGSVIGPNGIPPDKLFFAGGGGSVRGYEYQSLSPRDIEDNLIGGRSLVETSAELRWRASDRFGYVAFLDAGTAGQDVEPDFDTLRAGAGLGIRYYAGFGPLRADIAIPLDKRDSDADFQIYFSIGQAF